MFDSNGIYRMSKAQFNDPVFRMCKRSTTVRDDDRLVMVSSVKWYLSQEGRASGGGGGTAGRLIWWVGRLRGDGDKVDLLFNCGDDEQLCRDLCGSVEAVRCAMQGIERMREERAAAMQTKIRSQRLADALDDDNLPPLKETLAERLGRADEGTPRPASPRRSAPAPKRPIGDTSLAAAVEESLRRDAAGAGEEVGHDA